MSQYERLSKSLRWSSATRCDSHAGQIVDPYDDEGDEIGGSADMSEDEEI